MVCKVFPIQRFEVGSSAWSVDMADSNAYNRCWHCGGLPYICLARSNHKSHFLAPLLGLWPQAGWKQVFQKSCNTFIPCMGNFSTISRRYIWRLGYQVNATPPLIYPVVPIIQAVSFKSLFSSEFVSIRLMFNRAAEICGEEQWFRNNPKHSYTSPHKIRWT